MNYELNYRDIRDGVARLCADFPGEYWRRCDREQAYPTEFVKALSEDGYLSALIPEEYGGLGLPISAGAAILEEIHRAGCNAGACHAQMYTMGTLLRHGSDAQKEMYLPKVADGSLRLQAFGVTEPTSGTDTTALKTKAKRNGDKYIVNGQKIWTSRLSILIFSCYWRGLLHSKMSQRKPTVFLFFWSICETWLARALPYVPFGR